MRRKITKRVVDGVAMGERVTVWDTEVKGFGLRQGATGARTYVLKYWLGGRQRWFTIGKHGSPWSPDQARQRARELLGEVARGLDPATERSRSRDTLTVAELTDLYLAKGVSHKRPRSVRMDKSCIHAHVKPLLGTLRVPDVTKADIERLRDKIAVRNGRKGGPGAARQTVLMLSGMFRFAIERGMRVDNPCASVKTAPKREMKRFLTVEELGRLAAAIQEERELGTNPWALAAIVLLIYTGARRDEIRCLEWGMVDFEHGCLRLPDSKTGARIIFLNLQARTLLRDLPREMGNPLVIAGGRQHRPVWINRTWNAIRSRAQLKGVRLHDLRHTFASIGVGGARLNLPVVGALLGHRRASTTEIYAHLANDPLRASNEEIGSRIAAAMRHPAAGEEK